MEDTIVEEVLARPLEMSADRGSPGSDNQKDENKEQKSKLTRNKSIGSFRKFFKKHSRSLSEDQRQRDRSATFSSSSSKSGGCTTPSTPDDVFRYADDFISNDVIDENFEGYRSTTMPRTESESVLANKTGARLWRRARERLGSFSFSRQLSPSGSTPENGCLSPGNGKRRSPKAKIDSVYQVLKEGLVLRASTTGPGSSLSRNQSIESNSSQAGSDCGKQSISNSPTVAAKFKKTTTTSDNTTAQVSEEKALSNCSSDGFTPISDERPDNRKQNDRNDGGDYTMVALHKFEGQQRDDLLLRPGDIISVTDDRDEAWWIGTHEGKSGFFPSNFAMKLNSGEVVYSCLRVAHLMDINNKEVPLKKNQIVVVKPEVKVQDNNYVYSRIPNVEGYVKREDLKPV